MLRVATAVLLFVFLAVSGKTAQTLSSNGDTAAIMAQTLCCVALLAAAVYCKNVRRAGVE